jgi:hypothetical protein
MNTTVCDEHGGRGQGFFGIFKSRKKRSRVGLKVQNSWPLSRAVAV